MCKLGHGGAEDRSLHSVKCGEKVISPGCNTRYYQCDLERRTKLSLACRIVVQVLKVTSAPILR